jgi:hypothetical protein
MKKTIGSLSILFLLGCSALHAQQSQPAFNGLGMGMALERMV